MIGQAKLLIAAGALATAFLSGWFVNGWRYERDIAEIRREYAEAEIKNQAQARTEDASRHSSVDTAAEKGAQVIEAIRTDLRDDDTADRLRDELAALRKRYTIENSRLATASATDRQTILVLTELYQGADRRARDLAGALEEARARGVTCVEAYEGVRNHVAEK
jgi:hypothetical protein